MPSEGVVFREPTWDTFKNSPTGQVGQFMRRKGEEIATAARVQVGVRTGALKGSIHVRQERSARGQSMYIGSSEKHALMHHEGTKPHYILPTQGKMLRFSKNGRIVYTKSVWHPGTKPNRYLRDNLRLIQ